MHNQKGLGTLATRRSECKDMSVLLLTKEELKPLLSRWWQREKESSRPTRVWVRSKDVSTASKSNPAITIAAPTAICSLRQRVSRRPSARSEEHTSELQS